MVACAFVLLVTGTHAQRTGTIRLFIDPGSDFSFVLDHQYRMQQREVKVTEGPHHFIFWAPTRSMVDTTLMVVGDSIRSFRLRLPYSAEYTAYKRDLSSFNRREAYTRWVPAAATLGLGIWSAISFTNYRDADQKLKDDAASYTTEDSPLGINELKDETLPQDEQDLKDTQTTFIISTSLFVAAAAGTVYAFIRSGKRTVPVFKDQEKVRFDGLVWIPSTQGGQWAASLTIPIR